VRCVPRPSTQRRHYATKNEALRAHFISASLEETDHLAWTKQRLDELGDRPSLLNPLWYAGAFGLGLLAGTVGDRLSLGFVVETEKQVEAHLESHLDTPASQRPCLTRHRGANEGRRSPPCKRRAARRGAGAAAARERPDARCRQGDDHRGAPGLNFRSTCNCYYFYSSCAYIQRAEARFMPQPGRNWW
jgi:hypothetical protein